MSKYGIFIIESLRSKDYFDGETLSDILKLSKIPVKYAWADTKEDLVAHIAAFKKSKYRYLHLSCHADEVGIQINGENISNSEFQSLLKHAIAKKDYSCLPVKELTETWQVELSRVTVHILL